MISQRCRSGKCLAVGIQSALIGERRPLVSDNHVGQIFDLASVCYPRVVFAEPLNSQRARLHRCSHLVEVSADRTFLSPFTKGTRALAFVNTNHSICWAREGPLLNNFFRPNHVNRLSTIITYAFLQPSFFQSLFRNFLKFCHHKSVGDPSRFFFSVRASHCRIVRHPLSPPLPLSLSKNRYAIPSCPAVWHSPTLRYRAHGHGTFRMGDLL